MASGFSAFIWLIQFITPKGTIHKGRPQLRGGVGGWVGGWVGGGRIKRTRSSWLRFGAILAILVNFWVS
jgi:hypothetical protein